ncbi:MAG: hypothetical protein JNK78_08940 [Planctomycetes bacterium]|nr:hypothetical protein [Planctomycetota bacterium]
MPLVVLSFGRAVHVTECGDHVRFEFRTEDLAREFAACNEGAVLTAP